MVCEHLTGGWAEDDLADRVMTRGIWIIHPERVFGQYITPANGHIYESMHAGSFLAKDVPPSAELSRSYGSPYHVPAEFRVLSPGAVRR
jgi:hypothetical protein